MRLPADKIGHLKAGAAVAAFGLMVGLCAGALLSALMALDGPVATAMAFGMAGACALVSAVVAGITKEKADEADNAIHPGMHEVEVLDAVATALPGVLAFGGCYLAAWLVVRPALHALGG